MPVYLDVLMLLNFLVDLLLLVAANRLAGCSAGIKRAALASVAGGLYGGICVLPGLTFLSAVPWRLLILCLMAGIAFGFRKDALRRGILFLLLSMALGGIALGLNRGDLFGLIFSAGAVCVMCVFGFRGSLGQQYIAVRIGDCGFSALMDTGNSLTDPLTGQQVLVVSSSIGEKLLKLDRDQLKDPVRMVGAVPGMRLIPFHTVGRSDGMLPVKRYEDVRIGSWRGNCLVAFSPNEIGRGKPYEALTGGRLS